METFTQATMSAQAQSIVDSSEGEAKPLGRKPNSILKEFFIQNEPAFGRLVAMKEKVNPNLIFDKEGRLNNRVGVGRHSRRRLFRTTTSSGR